jgi:hypothetical protein
MAKRLNFIFDYVTPHGHLGFGYQRKEIPEIFEYATHLNFDKSLQVFHCRRNQNQEIKHSTSFFVEELLGEHIDSTVITTDDIKNNNVNEGEEYLIPFESVYFRTHFSEILEPTFNFDECFSKKLLHLIKKYSNFRILFVDAREGSYYVDNKVFTKMQTWLDSHNIRHINKIIISSCDELLEKKIPNDNRFVFFNNDSYISAAGQFVIQVQKKDKTLLGDIERDNYEYDLKLEFEESNPKKYFNMFNRNSERIHRPYFVGRLKEENLLDKGYVSLFRNIDFENWVDNHMDEEDTSSIYGIQVTPTMKETIREIKNKYPYYIDEEDGDRVANLHNFLSVKKPYVESLFTIVSETSASSDYLFITEKTLKPIMNLHPFFVVGNPHTLKKLKRLGFKTFSMLWDESYDDELDFAKRTEMIIKEVKDLCNLSFEELTQKFRKIKNICIYNREVLVKLYYRNYKYNQLLQCLKKEII